MTSPGSLCSDTRYEIKSETECKNAATALGHEWNKSWTGDNDFPVCFFAHDWRKSVFFNLSPNPNRTNVHPKYSAICYGT